MRWLVFTGSLDDGACFAAPPAPCIWCSEAWCGSTCLMSALQKKLYPGKPLLVEVIHWLLCIQWTPMVFQNQHKGPSLQSALYAEQCPPTRSQTLFYHLPPLLSLTSPPLSSHQAFLYLYDSHMSFTFFCLPLRPNYSTTWTLHCLCCIYSLLFFLGLCCVFLLHSHLLSDLSPFSLYSLADLQPSSVFLGFKGTQGPWQYVLVGRLVVNSYPVSSLPPWCLLHTFTDHTLHCPASLAAFAPLLPWRN